MEQIAFPPACERMRGTWQALYHAALYEKDWDRVPARIAEAEHAIGARLQELVLVNTDHIEEDQLLDDALYSLRALRNCVVRPNAA